MKWYRFDKAKGSRQKRPPIKKWVVVLLVPAPPRRIDLPGLAPDVPGLIAHAPSGIAIGYRKDAAGDVQCPYFVVPGIGGEVYGWCDCLSDDFSLPDWYTEADAPRETESDGGGS